MADDLTPQYFEPDAQGDSRAIYKILADNQESLQASQIKARNRQFKQTPATTMALDGIPGIPFERGTPNPDLFYQGEDIVYDLFLFNEGAAVTADDYSITAAIKTSPRASNYIWLGSVDNGVYPTPNQSGYYELWIPAAITESFVAGTYYLHVQIQAKGTGRYDRKCILLQTYFNIDYSVFSPNLESATNTTVRSTIEQTWPNKSDTIGRFSGKGSEYSIPAQSNIDPTQMQ